MESCIRSIDESGWGGTPKNWGPRMLPRLSNLWGPASPGRAGPSMWLCRGAAMAGKVFQHCSDDLSVVELLRDAMRCDASLVAWSDDSPLKRSTELLVATLLSRR